MNMLTRIPSPSNNNMTANKIKRERVTTRKESSLSFNSLSTSFEEPQYSDIQKGVDTLLNLFVQAGQQNKLFPRTITTKVRPYQEVVYSKEEMMQKFQKYVSIHGFLMDWYYNCEALMWLDKE